MSEPHSPQIFLGRQPILGREQQLVAYELLFRDGVLAADQGAQIVDPTKATATVITNAFTELAAHAALGPYTGFINIDRELLFSDLIEVLPPQLVVLEILESIFPAPDVIARCRQLRDLGFVLAVDDIVQIEAAYLPLLELTDIIKVDILKLDVDRLRGLTGELKKFGKKLLAEKVESNAQLSLCQDLGFELFQGYYFARPTIIVGRRINPEQAALLRLLALVMEDADTHAIENAFKVEPGLTVNMLRLTNSVSCGLSTKITSLRHAITILGRRQLQRWLQLLIYTNPKGNAQANNPLLQLAASRGRLMELLADRLQSRNRELGDHAFMVGIMSLMPTLLGMAMTDILAQLPVAQRVKQALIENPDQCGQLGQLLLIVEATELTDPEALQDALQRLPAIHPEFLSNCLARAFSWANNLGQEQDSESAEA
ncbi:MAG: EAL domain-containing protein [Propionivibrio sp.]|uniref:EAL and HDOD domain-containing protein n=1 Tax=Propionivibrio sp. TaxID=2212460 RepID=UPI0025DEF787|nr:EAL domain-containing protein [Propionivibrio sp.]MBK7355830.1 EAL domain-containing protein [Propionivibrio sp.]MBK8400507.1 EAL domain-containing protein [Propionivibrio sp.]MBL0206866.1 EAL domain-containing protein [Propionivibrio sp.]